MNIKVDVSLTAPELAESINRLAEALPNLVIPQEPVKESLEVRLNEPTAKEEPKKPAKKTRKEIVASEGAENTKGPESKTITLEEVRAKLATLSQDGKQAQVKALITEFGAKKLSDVSAKKYAELLEKAEGL